MKNIEQNLKKFLTISKRQKDGVRTIQLGFIEKVLGVRFFGNYKATTVLKDDGVYIFIVKKNLFEKYKEKLTPPVMDISILFWYKRGTSFLLVRKRVWKLAGLLDSNLMVEDIQVDWKNLDYVILKIKEKGGNKNEN